MNVSRVLWIRSQQSSREMRELVPQSFTEKNGGDLYRPAHITCPSDVLRLLPRSTGAREKDTLLDEPAVAPKAATDSLRSPRLTSNLGHPGFRDSSLSIPKD